MRLLAVLRPGATVASIEKRGAPMLAVRFGDQRALLGEYEEKKEDATMLVRRAGEQRAEAKIGRCPDRNIKT